MATVTGVSGPAAAASWRPVPTGEDAVAAAERAALGTSARVVVSAAGKPQGGLRRRRRGARRTGPAGEQVPPGLRDSWRLVHALPDGRGLFLLSDGAGRGGRPWRCAAARLRPTRPVPTRPSAARSVGLGYDRDFAAVTPGHGPAGTANRPAASPGWRRGADSTRRPVCCRLPARHPAGPGRHRQGRGRRTGRRAPPWPPAGLGGGVLVSLGGDIAVGRGRPARRAAGPGPGRRRAARDGRPDAPVIAADPAGRRPVATSIGDLPALAPRRRRTASHRGSPAPGCPLRRAVADRDRRGSQTCADANAASHRGDRPR